MSCRRRKNEPVKASDLAQMGACERLVWFEHTCGRHTSKEQDHAVRHGNAAHESFYQDAVRYEADERTAQAKPWCWIASAAYGPMAWGTWMLRQFRDLTLRRSRLGRYAIALYYRTAPVVAALVSRSQLARRAARAPLAPMVMLAYQVTRTHEAKHNR